MAYPVYCSTCGKHVGNVMDKARMNEAFYCREHAPRPSTALSERRFAQDAGIQNADVDRTPEKAEPAKAQQPAANKSRKPKENK